MDKWIDRWNGGIIEVWDIRMMEKEAKIILEKFFCIIDVNLSIIPIFQLNIKHNA
ncbi:MAG: hypothetical protein K8S16_05140 [Bacteroidales bacterium]|nr:hypothetical protein [Bacteroidales bacterium]